jgi:hypothetical protein
VKNKLLVFRRGEPISVKWDGLIRIESESGQTLFEVDLLPCGTLRVSGGDECCHEGIVLSDALLVAPMDRSIIEIRKEPSQ